MKTRNLLVAAALVLALSGAAFAQGTISTGTQARVAEEHKYGAQMGAVTLAVSSGTTLTGSVTMSFVDSANNPVNVISIGGVIGGQLCAGASSLLRTPLSAPPTAANVVAVENLVTGLTAASVPCTLTGLRLDLRGLAPGTQVFVNFASTANTIVANQTQALVISQIKQVLSLGTTVLGTKPNIGGLSTQGSVPVNENVIDGWTTAAQEAAFGGGTVGQEVDVIVQGVPNLTVLHVGVNALPAPATMSIVVGATTTVITQTINLANPLTFVTLTGTGGDLSFTYRFNTTNLGALEIFGAAAFLDDGTAPLPLPGGDIVFEFAMGPGDGGLAVPGLVPSFEEIWSFEATLIRITAADCTLLSNLATVTNGGVGGGGIDTGISIANTSAFGGVQAITGPIVFTFYDQTAAPFSYPTTASSPGSGLVAGELAAGGTYVVLLSELLADVPFAGDFNGHYFATGEFLYCHGFNFISDFATFSQSFIPEVVPTGPRPAVSGAAPEGLGQ